MGGANASSEAVLFPWSILLLVFGSQSLECPSVLLRACWGPSLRLHGETDRLTPSASRWPPTGSGLIIIEEAVFF